METLHLSEHVNETSSQLMDKVYGVMSKTPFQSKVFNA